MKMVLDKEWFEKRAAAEGDHEIGAGGNRKTMTLNLTENDIAELERLVNPNRDAIRAEAFELAAALVDRTAVEVEKEAAEKADGIAHDAMLIASDVLELTAGKIRALSASPAPKDGEAGIDV